ncbi:oxidoreductase [Streptomyces sp. NPDC087420]|uniref:oxidoreductase n=1 Tax=Streptomyces sp. NPDC087420 TaxID=3365785 RepID=UPI0038343650
MSTWLITGASRGFGLEIARAALAEGHQVAATARDTTTLRTAFPEAGDALLALPLDVTDEARAKAAVAEAVERFGGIDVLVNNAGQGMLGAVEEVGDEAARAVFDTNVFGTLNVLRAVLPVMRARRSGHIINITSVGGFDGVAGWGLYAATKFAIEGFSESLRRETEPLGVQVTIVEPGYFRTDFLDASSLRREETVIADYAATVGQSRERAVRVNHAQPGDPVKAARIIVGLGQHPDAPHRLQLGADAVDRVEAKLDLMRDELAAWREVSVSTDHDDVPGV